VLLHNGGFCDNCTPKRCLQISVNFQKIYYKTTFLHNGYLKSMEFYESYITLFCLKKTFKQHYINSEHYKQQLRKSTILSRDLFWNAHCTVIWCSALWCRSCRIHRYVDPMRPVRGARLDSWTPTNQKWILLKSFLRGNSSECLHSIKRERIVVGEECKKPCNFLKWSSLYTHRRIFCTAVLNTFKLNNYLGTTSQDYSQVLVIIKGMGG